MASILSYCMNVHPGESLEDLISLLGGPAARVRQAWRGADPMGAGLWLPRETARSIANDPSAAQQVRAALGGAGLFPFTVNAFPIGGFHGERVKRSVYRPTWASDERLDYTLEACQALAALLPEGARGSVSTVPVGYKAFAEEGVEAAAGARLGRCALALLRLEEASGREVSLALEPEPLALLETTPEAIAFLEAHVFAGAGREAYVSAGGARARAEADLRRLVGVCVDTCHLACQFEDLAGSLASLAAAGVRVVKAQLSSALELRDPSGNAAGRQRLLSFDEPRYLHQSVARDPAGALTRFEDLSDLLGPDGELVDPARDAETVRTHFHVPLGWGGDEVLGTTRATLVAGLGALVQATDHLEVETYTFGVLPDADRARYGDDVVNMVVEELRWAESALEGAATA